MAKNTKTPVMVLTELAIKRGHSVPEFNLIYSRCNTHDNEFAYQVSVEGVVARGNGKSKKEAKQNTAHRALEMLNEIGICHPDYSSIEDPVRRGQDMPSPKKPSVNCIGTLSDLCLENKLPDPEYVEISDVGPPHCREFTYDCHLGSITTRATAGTKKQARQLAAKEMLDRVKDIVVQISEEYNDSIKKLSDRDSEAICRYEELSNFGVKQNLSVKIVNYCDTLINLINERSIDVQALHKYFSQPYNTDNLTKLLDELGLKYAIEVLQTEPFIVCLNVNLDTPFSTMAKGGTAEKAITSAVVEAFETIKMFID